MAVTRLNGPNTDILQAVYPVGSIYLNASNAANPATLLGFGTWERLGQGRMMVDADATYSAGGTGGAATHNHGGSAGATTLSADQIPAHTHGSKSLTGSFQVRRYGTGLSDVVASATGIVSISAKSGTSVSSALNYVSATHNRDTVTVNATHEHTSVGGGKSHAHTIGSASNMPPWVGVYMWKRTA